MASGIDGIIPLLAGRPCRNSAEAEQARSENRQPTPLAKSNTTGVSILIQGRAPREKIAAISAKPLKKHYFAFRIHFSSLRVKNESQIENL